MMMKESVEFFFYTPSGEITMVGTCALDELDLQEPPEGVLRGFGAASCDLHYYDEVIGEAVRKPVPPSQFYKWNWATKSWLPDLDAARKAKLQEVATELDRRLYLPCNDFDADNVSRERISGMIARLQRGDGLPTGWLGWRDASNQMHWASDSAETVLSNLITLSRAIEDREQALLVAGWAHKANIEQLTTFDEIEAYDTNIGW
jgi:hypothetical protein